MEIISLKMIEGDNASFDLFENKTLVISDVNSVGKTTFLRLLLHSLGYKVPAMKNVNYDKITTTVVFEEKGDYYCAVRESSFSFRVRKNNEQEMIYNLPEEHLLFLERVFGERNADLLKSILGTIYIDQEKGWSLVNRGTVIGRNRFDVEVFMAGLCNIDVSDLESQKDVLEKENSNLEALLEIQSIKDENSDSIEISDLMIEENKVLLNKINIINTKIRNENKEIRSIEQAINNETQFFEYIDSLALEAIDSNGNIVVLTKNNIRWKDQITPLLKTQLSIRQSNIRNLKNEKDTINATINQKMMESGLLAEEPIGARAAISLAQTNVDIEGCEERIAENKRKISDINASIRRRIESNTAEVDRVNELIRHYASELLVDDRVLNESKIIFTKDIKSYSGAILKKLSLAFKMAFHKTIENKLDTKLPFIIDSPFGKELDDDNVELIHKFLLDNLNDNQLIVASIKSFEGCTKNIVIKDRAISPRGDMNNSNQVINQ